VANVTSDSVQIVDVSNPALPTLAGTATTSGPVSSVAVDGRYVYASGLIIDVSSPANPVIFSNSGPGGAMVISGRYAYELGTTNLNVLDLGGAYIQQLEAGTIETGTMQTRDSVAVGNELDVRGGLTVSGSARISGGLGADFVSATNFIGNGGGLTNLSAGQLNGVVSLAQMPPQVVTNNDTTSVTLTGTFSGNGSGLTNLPVPSPSGYAFVYDTSGGAVAAGAPLPLASVGVTNGWSLNTSTSTLTVSNAGPYLVQFEGWSTSSTHNPVAVAVNGTPVTGGGTFIVANAEFYHSFITTLTANQMLQVVNLGGTSLTLSAPATGEPAFSVTITQIK
jgi:hypothetical protein